MSVAWLVPRQSSASRTLYTFACEIPAINGWAIIRRALHALEIGESVRPICQPALTIKLLLHLVQLIAYGHVI